MKQDEIKEVWHCIPIPEGKTGREHAEQVIEEQGYFDCMESETFEPVRVYENNGERFTIYLEEVTKLEFDRIELVQWQKSGKISRHELKVALEELEKQNEQQ
jgi:hypothetical protein